MRAATRFTDAVSVRVRSANYVRKWIVLGLVIGVVAGLGAIVFTEALQLATRFFLVGLGGYQPPSPLGEGAAVGSAHFTRPWAIPLVVALGGLISGVLVFAFAPEAEGHGTDAAIEAVHHNPKGIRGRVSIVKIIASAVTIGSEGSAGREGPTAQISAGFASLLARWLDLTPSDARIAVAVGIGSGIGAIFRAPLGGAVLGAEILYRSDFEVDALCLSRWAVSARELRGSRSPPRGLILTLSPPWQTSLQLAVGGDAHSERAGRLRDRQPSRIRPRCSITPNTPAHEPWPEKETRSIQARMLP